MSRPYNSMKLLNLRRVHALSNLKDNLADGFVQTQTGKHIYNPTDLERIKKEIQTLTQRIQ